MSASSHGVTTTSTAAAGGSASSSTTAAPAAGGGASTTTAPSTVPGASSPSTSVASASVGGPGATTSTTSVNRPPQAPGAPHAPTPGTYQYKSTDQDGDVTQVQVTVQGSGSGPGGALDQTLTISTKQGSEKSVYTWSPSGVMVSSTTLSGQQGSVSCKWTPDVSQYTFPIHVGSTWSSDSHCTTTVAGQPSKVTYSDQVSVSGYAWVTEAGQTLDTWVLQRRTVLDLTSAAFTLNDDTTSTEYFAPSDGQTPKELMDTKTSGTYAGKSYNSETKSTVEAETL